MKPKGRSKAGLCYDCRLLDMRALRDGRTVFWCELRRKAVPERYVWRRGCRGFVPFSQPPV